MSGVSRPKFERLVTLNAVRRSEETSGLIRWLRPAYQAPDNVADHASSKAFLTRSKLSSPCGSSLGPPPFQTSSAL